LSRAAFDVSGVLATARFGSAGEEFLRRVADVAEVDASVV
jgi:hypothetical protein